VQANEVKDLMDLGQPTGGEEKKAAGRLSAAFSQGFFGGGNNGVLPKLAQDEAGTGACFHARRSSMRGQKSSAGAARGGAN